SFVPPVPWLSSPPVPEDTPPVPAPAAPPVALPPPPPPPPEFPFELLEQPKAPHTAAVPNTPQSFQVFFMSDPRCKAVWTGDVCMHVERPRRRPYHEPTRALTSQGRAPFASARPSWESGTHATET